MQPLHSTLENEACSRGLRLGGLALSQPRRGGACCRLQEQTADCVGLAMGCSPATQPSSRQHWTAASWLQGVHMGKHVRLYTKCAACCVLVLLCKLTQ